MFERFSQRARRVIFWSQHYSRLAGSGYIEPEHILEGLLKEDPPLFRLILPNRPELVTEVQRKLESARSSARAMTEKRAMPLSPPGKAVVVAAASEQERLGHPQVTDQHLLLAMLKTPAPFAWFGKRKQSPVQMLLGDYGMTAELVEEKIKEGIVTLVRGY